jgi:D-alanyl-D-alanine carboxypeptidase
MAVVVGGESVEARDEKAADLLTRGFATAQETGPMIGQLTRATTGAPNVAVNMTDQLCSKKGRAAKAKKWKEHQAAMKAGKAEMPIYSAKLSRPRNLVLIQLGGAEGPVPEAVVAAQAATEAQAYADVPIPTWRPDMPVPGLRTTEQGDTAAVQ